MSGEPLRTGHPLLHLLPYLHKYRRRIVIGALMVLLTNGTAVLFPMVLGNAVDSLREGLTRSLLVTYAGLLVGVSAVEGFFRYQMRRILIGMSRYVEYDLRNEVFSHLQTLTPSFYQRTPTGDLMSRATNDLSAVRMVLGPGIMYSVNTFFTTVFVVAILISISPRLALLTLIPLAAVSLSVKYFGKRIHQRFEKIQEQFSVLTSLAQENVAGIRVVKAYNQERASIERFRKANDDYIRKSLSLVKISGLYSPLLALLLGLSSVGLLWYGGRQVVQGVITHGDFVAFMAYLAMLAWPTIALGWVINIFERGSASMGRIRRILNEEPDVLDETPSVVTNLRGHIRIRNLTFSYNGRPVLKDLDFEVPAGKTLAVVGNTGSGKSTLVNLLCRLHPVPRGKILIDGIDLNDIPLTTLRRNIGYVAQDTFLFSETIRENIAFGKPEASIEEIEEASRISNVHPDIQDFPQKFETFVGERGITLSGGQKQRLAISRAVLLKPAILILDDALSSVDTYTEEVILQRLTAQMRGRTTLLISHRISTVKTADEILVLEDGEIVEKGTHEALLREGRRYSQLNEKQLLREELELE